MLELIYERSLFPELAYMFKHALTQDVAYNSLLLQRRRELHRLVAVVIEELYADRLAEHHETLAHHYEQAEVWEKALEYLVKAGQKCQQAYASQGALIYFDRALAACERLGQPVQPATLMTILSGKGLAHILMTEVRPAAVTYQRLLEVAQTEQDQSRALEALAHLGTSFLWAHEFEKTLQYAELARTRGLNTNNRFMLAASDFLIASVGIVTGKVNESLSRFQELLILVRETRNLNIERMVVEWLGVIHNFRGEYEIATTLLSQRMTLAKTEKLMLNLLLLSWMLGVAQGGKGEFQQALASLSECLEWSDRLGDQFFKCRALNTLGWVYGELLNLSPAMR